MDESNTSSYTSSDEENERRAAAVRPVAQLPILLLGIQEPGEPIVSPRLKELMENPSFVATIVKPPVGTLASDHVFLRRSKASHCLSKLRHQATARAHSEESTDNEKTEEVDTDK